MRRLAVLDVVALTHSLLQQMPRLRVWGAALPIEPLLPAVTCPIQATYLTGAPPSIHGIVGNGWYFRDECKVRFWRQSNRLVQGPLLWEQLREEIPGFTCAKLFWWFNMYSSVDYSVTVRPMYPNDGRKISDLYTHPGELRYSLQNAFGRFPLFDFWGPLASFKSTEWIAESARYVEERYRPDLSLVYLPHLDYNLQRLGPNIAQLGPDLAALDRLLDDLLAFYATRGVEVVILSEYGMNAVSNPVHINRALRSQGWVRIREELGLELLDPGASPAFAVADHQVAHVYVNDSRLLTQVRVFLQQLAGVEYVLEGAGKAAQGLDHSRTGDLIAVADQRSWFTYYYWLHDNRAPDFARTVDIHRKPGYDPAELFFDSVKPWPRARAAFALALRRLGLRAQLTLTPLSAELVRGSHGRPAPEHPLFLTRLPELVGRRGLAATEVCGVLKRLVTLERPVDIS